MVDNKENYKFDLGVKGLTKIHCEDCNTLQEHVAETNPLEFCAQKQVTQIETGLQLDLSISWQF